MSQEISPTACPKIGFVGWNPFQFLHVARIVSKFPDATLIVEERRNSRQLFNYQKPAADKAEVVFLDRKKMEKLDGQYDVLVCQTPFVGIENIRNTKIAMLQYGYAKEAHNFAPWRSFGDVCLTFGNYASRKIAPFCACVPTGNPRYEEWHVRSFHEAARIKYASQFDPAKKTVLYAPTWGPLSSYKQFGESVLALAKHFNVIFKIHHNTERSAGRSMDPMRKKFGVIHGADEDIVELLSITDVMISDFSGAIFDAIYCKVPVVLLNPSSTEFLPESKSDHHSIERARRADLGEIVELPEQLQAVVARSMEPASLQRHPKTGLRDDLFDDPISASGRAAAAIGDLAAGKFQQTQSQSYIREEMRAYYQSKNQFRYVRILQRLLTRGVRAMKSNPNS